ncbi:MAG: biotin/lipoyl-containing protein, partial [Pseudomonadota bacterium]
MPREVIMPKVDMDMASGKLIAWHVAEGQRVARGDVLFDIETDKAAMEVEAEASGTLYHPIAPGTDVVIGAPVAWLYEEGEAPPSPGTSPPGTPETDSGAQKTQGTAAHPAAEGKAAHPAAEGTVSRPAAEGTARTDRQAPGARVETAPGAAVQVAAPLETAVAMAASDPALSPQPGTAFSVPKAPEAPVDAGQSPDSPAV